MKITCLVDNCVEAGSSLWGEHGLAMWIETGDGRILFDTGSSGTVLLHNLEEMQLELDAVSALAISHAHYDHTGGLAAVLQKRRGLPLYANADLLRKRFGRRGETVKEIGLRLPAESLRQQAELHLSGTPQQVLPGVWTTGEITERGEPEGRSKHHVVRQGDNWVPDPYCDDLSLVLDTPRGLVLVCGCCHAGLLNTLVQVKRVFGRDPIAVVGGTHLMSADAEHMRHLLQVLDGLGPPLLYPNHCTGTKGYVTLAQAFGERVSPFPAGTRLEFPARAG